jgi:hypothetical protein
MINWASLQRLIVPEGEVEQVAIDGTVVWVDYMARFQRVEYIEAADDKPYMVTDIIADTETGVECEVMFFSFMDRAMLGSRPTSGNTRFYSPYPLAAATSVYYGYNSGNYVGDASIPKDTKRVARLNFKNDRTVSVLDVDGNVLGTSNLPATLAEQTTPIGIFRQIRGYTGTNLSRPGRFYSIKISQGGDVIREYVPCYRKSDNVVGLYEMYTGQFLTNAGEGEFSKGADIAW